MSVPDGPCLTEEQLDALVAAVPDLTAKQLWNVAATFDVRIVAFSDDPGHGAESDIELAGRQRIGFAAE